jgi:hypothetical protein
MDLRSAWRGVPGLPQTAWLSDASLIVYDSRLPPELRKLERFDPVTSKSRLLVDGRRAILNLTAMAPDTKTESLPWPIAFDNDGREALYIFKGDVFVLEFATASFVA